MTDEEGVVNKTNQFFGNFYIEANKYGWRKNEPSRAEKEEARLFSLLIYRAVTESDISIQKGAELLRDSYENVMRKCFPIEI